MPLSNEALLGRIEDVLRRVGSVEHDLRENRPAVLAAKIEDLEDDVSGLRKDLAAFRAEALGEVRGLRKVVLGSAITFAGSAVILALTIVLTFGGSG